jgi:hypothetical protein
MRKKTKQETFDAVVSGLIEQGGPSAGENDCGPTCFYRGKDGRKCAVGLLVPDDEYQEEWENQAVGAGLDVDDWLYDNGYDILFCGRLQDAHDIPVFNGEDDDEGWLEEFIVMVDMLAKECGLDRDVLYK